MITRRLLKWHRQLPNNPQFDSSIEVFQSHSGYGIRATQDLPRLRTVIRVPPSGWRELSAELAVNEARRSNPHFYESLTKFAALVLPNSSEQADTLIKSSCLATKLVIDKQESLRHPYIEFLDQATFPSNKSVLPHPLLMRGDEFGGANCLLRGSTSHRAIVLRQKMYNYIGESLFGQGNPTVEEFKWAMGVVLSRALSSAPLGMPLTLVPVLDLVNHSYAAQNADHAYNKVTGEFSLVTTKDVEAGEELFINYGEGRDTASFMSLYGFYDVDNSNDDVAFHMDNFVECKKNTLPLVLGQGQQGDFNYFRGLMSKQHGVIVNPIAKKEFLSEDPITMRISSLSRLPLEFLLSFDRREGTEMLETLLKTTESEDTNRLRLCNEVVAAAHDSLGKNILAAARNIVSASISTRYGSHRDGVYLTGDKESSEENIVENEILAAQIMLASIERNIDAFDPNHKNDSNTFHGDNFCSVNLIIAEREKSASLIAAEARLRYLLDEGSQALALLSDPTRKISSKDLSNHSPVLPSSTPSPFESSPQVTSPSDAQLKWRIATSAVAARELDALLRLRSFCTAFLIALASSL